MTRAACLLISSLAAALLASGAWAANGPGPIPSPWYVTSGGIAYDKCVLIPQSVTGGCEGAGSLNVSQLYISGNLLSFSPSALAALSVPVNTAGGVSRVAGTPVAGHCVEFDSSLNIVDAGGVCSTGGGGGTVSLGTASQMAYYSATGTTVSGLASGTSAQILLGGSPPSWGKLTATQMASGAAASNLGYTALNAANNLLDVVSASLARTNLGLGALATLSTIGASSMSPGAAAANLGASASAVTALGNVVGSAGSIVVNGGALGTPSSGTLTNATGLPISGLTGLGTGVAGALGSPTNTGAGVLAGAGAAVTNLGYTPDAISVKAFGASGSTTQTMGAISAGSATLALAAPIDFANGQGIAIFHAGAAFSTAYPTGLTVAPQGGTGSTSWSYAIAPLDHNGGIGAVGATTTITNGVATLSSTTYNALSWTAPVSGTQPYGYAIYGGPSAGSMYLIAMVAASHTTYNDVYGLPYGNTATYPAAPPTVALADTLITSIVSGGGATTLTLAMPASAAVTGGVVWHDDTAAIQAVLNLGASSPTRVHWGAGVYSVCRLVYYSNETLQGDGRDVAQLLARPACNDDVLVSSGASSSGDLVSSLWGTNSQNGVYDVNISNLTINSYLGANVVGNGISHYGSLVHMDNLRIVGAPGSCIRSEWGPGFEPWAFQPGGYLMEGSLSHIRCDVANGPGIVWNGPHDSNFEDIRVAGASYQYNGLYSEIYIGPNAGGLRGHDVHVWGKESAWCIDDNAWNVGFVNSTMDTCGTGELNIQASQFNYEGVVEVGATTATPLSMANKGFVIGASGNALADVRVNASGYNVPHLVTFGSQYNDRIDLHIQGVVTTAGMGGSNAYGYQGSLPISGKVYIYNSGATNNPYTNEVRGSTGGNTGVLTVGSGGNADPAYSGVAGISLRTEGRVSVGVTGAEALTLSRFGGTGNVAVFLANTTQVGSISIGASSTSYNTTSDRRSKQDIADIQSPLARVRALHPVAFAYRAEPTRRLDGLLADEVEAVAPYAVTGTRDAVDEHGQPVYQQLDLSKLVPITVGAVRELDERELRFETNATWLIFVGGGSLFVLIVSKRGRRA